MILNTIMPTIYLHWLKHCLERLGGELTLELWRQTFSDYDETLLLEILSAGWPEAAEQRSGEVEAEISSALKKLFPLQGVSRAARIPILCGACLGKAESTESNMASMV